MKRALVLKNRVTHNRVLGKDPQPDSLISSRPFWFSVLKMQFSTSAVEHNLLLFRKTINPHPNVVFCNSKYACSKTWKQHINHTVFCAPFFLFMNPIQILVKCMSMLKMAEAVLESPSKNCRLIWCDLNYFFRVYYCVSVYSNYRNNLWLSVRRFPVEDKIFYVSNWHHWEKEDKVSDMQVL